MTEMSRESPFWRLESLMPALIGVLVMGCYNTETVDDGRENKGLMDSSGASENDIDSFSDRSESTDDLDTYYGRIVDEDTDTLCSPIQTLEECRATESCSPIEGSRIDLAGDCVIPENVFLVCHLGTDCEDAEGVALNPENGECYDFNNWCFPPGWIQTGGGRCAINWDKREIYCPE